MYHHLVDTEAIIMLQNTRVAIRKLWEFVLPMQEVVFLAMERILTETSLFESFWQSSHAFFRNFI